jgi:MerR family redox-sensitive transcriptional activator SoxR
MEQGLLSISEVGQATGLTSSALRYYEKAGLITSQARRGGRRHYTPDVLQRLAVIALLQEVGFTIKEMGTLIRRHGRKDRWRSLAEDKLNEIDSHMERVNQARELLVSAISCECKSLDNCELVTARRGRHRRAIQTLSVSFGPPHE